MRPVLVHSETSRDIYWTVLLLDDYNVERVYNRGPSSFLLSKKNGCESLPGNFTTLSLEYATLRPSKRQNAQLLGCDGESLQFAFASTNHKGSPKPALSGARPDLLAATLGGCHE